jgi:hypothetical protein
MKLSTLTVSCITVASIIFSAGIAPAQVGLDKSLDVNATAETSNGQAISTSTNTYMSRSNTTDFHILKPFNLVYLAYQGNLKSQGIPGGSNLIFQHQKGNLKAKDLVKAAVEAKKLPSQILQDQNYLNMVDVYLASLDKTFWH